MRTKAHQRLLISTTIATLLFCGSAKFDQVETELKAADKLGTQTQLLYRQTQRYRMTTCGTELGNTENTSNQEVLYGQNKLRLDFPPDITQVIVLEEKKSVKIYSFEKEYTNNLLPQIAS